MGVTLLRLQQRASAKSAKLGAYTLANQRHLFGVYGYTLLMVVVELLKL